MAKSRKTMAQFTMALPVPGDQDGVMLIVEVCVADKPVNNILHLLVGMEEARVNLDVARSTGVVQVCLEELEVIDPLLQVA